MTSPTHDATALAVALVLFPPAGDAAGLFVSALVIAYMGVAEAQATRRQRRELVVWREHVNRLVAEGVPRDVAQERVDRPHWHGPRRSATRPLRVLALLGAASASVPLAVALGCARLPDQLEVGPIDHRRLTHFLLTAAGLILGLRYGLDQLVPGTLSAVQAEQAWQAFAVGYLTHLAMDGCTRSGVPLLWPLCREDVHLIPEKVSVPCLVGQSGELRPRLVWQRRKVRVAPRTGGVVDVLVMFGALASVILAAQG